MRMGMSVSLEIYVPKHANRVTSITNTLQSYHDDVKSSEFHDRGIVAGLKEQLETLAASIDIEHDLREQMKNITTKKAEVDVKLYAAGER